MRAAAAAAAAAAATDPFSLTRTFAFDWPIGSSEFVQNAHWEIGVMGPSANWLEVSIQTFLNPCCHIARRTH
jgi:hypothetical protein